MGSQARVLHHQHPVFIRAQIAYNAAGIAGGVVVGHIPAGARIRPVEAFVTTAFNASLTNPVQVGFIAESNGQPVAAITPQTQLAVVAGQTAGYALAAAPAGQNGVATTDLAVVVSFVPTGTAPTAGVADVVVSYYPNL